MWTLISIQIHTVGASSRTVPTKRLRSFHGGSKFCTIRECSKPLGRSSYYPLAHVVKDAVPASLATAEA